MQHCQPIAVFDAFETLVQYKDFNTFLDVTPEVARLRKVFRDSGKTLGRQEYMNALDENLASGRLQTECLHGVEATLDNLAEQGYALAVYSYSNPNGLLAMVEQAGLMRLFPDRNLLLTCYDLQGLPKHDPEAFVALEQRLGKKRYELKLFADDDSKVIEAAVLSQASIPRVYHVNAGFKGAVPLQEGKKITVASVNQILELKK